MILPTASASCESALCVSLIFGSVEADRSGGTPTYGNAVPWPKTQASAVQEAPQKRLGRGRPSIPCVHAGVRAQRRARKNKRMRKYAPARTERTRICKQNAMGWATLAFLSSWPVLLPAP